VGIHAHTLALLSRKPMEAIRDILHGPAAQLPLPPQPGLRDLRGVQPIPTGSSHVSPSP